MLAGSLRQTFPLGFRFQFASQLEFNISQTPDLKLTAPGNSPRRFSLEDFGCFLTLGSLLRDHVSCAGHISTHSTRRCQEEYCTLGPDRAFPRAFSSILCISPFRLGPTFGNASKEKST